MVDTDAGLAGVEELAEDYAGDGGVDVGGLVHDGGALAAQLQQAWGQVLGGLYSHKLACLGRACEAYHVKWKRSELFGNINSPLNTAIIPYY